MLPECMDTLRDHPADMDCRCHPRYVQLRVATMQVRDSLSVGYGRGVNKSKPSADTHHIHLQPFRHPSLALTLTFMCQLCTSPTPSTRMLP